ncbi:MAG: PhzF family phenazine biosynthesis protein [Chitinophagaceae bacterium]|nr:MAG: PhzF family phenazine biosynthesis protein [Chitinophagaceae bacterium]
MNVEIQVINAFSVNGTGGNPAGVVFDADAIPAAMRQRIATAAGFPETAFVSASAAADFRLEFFTPVKQIPHCGHATIATFSYLKNSGRITGAKSSKETIDGCRDILFRDGLAFMEQKAPRIELPADLGPIFRSLGISAADLIPGKVPAIVNTGNAYLIVPIRDAATLAAIRYDRGLVSRISEQYGLIGFYPYAPAEGFDATARMFAPFYGIDEEAGTGMAAGPLAAYLWETGRRSPERLRIEQGRFMEPASPSLILVDLEVSEGRITRLFSGGAAHLNRKLSIGVS